MSVYENPKQMWFGTERRMQWIDVPESGADVSPVGASAGSVLLNGGAFQRNSWGGSKRYSFSWGNSASRELAGAIHAYRNGTYGRGLIYFLDPMWLDRNVLPKFWADPTMAVNFEAPPLVADVWPTGSPVALSTRNTPVDSATYAVPANYDPQAAGTELCIPIPPGHTLWIGGWGATTGDAEVSVRIGGTRTPVALLATTATPGPVMATSFAGEAVAYVGIVGDTTPETVTLNALQAQILPTGITPDASAPWMPGEGHSGCRFEGDPTLVNYTGLFGGQVGVAATFVEVGAWA